MIDFTSPILDLDGEAIKENERDMTLGGVVQMALLLPFHDERDLPGDEKARRAVLAMRIHGGATALTIEEIALCKKLVGKAFPPLTVMRAWQILDPASVRGDT